MPGGPGGALASRPLHFIWIADCSGSMRYNGKIQALNNAIRETIPHMRRVARENPHAKVLVRVMAFSDDATWLVNEPTPIEQFAWQDLTDPAGVTNMGAALNLVADSLDRLGNDRGLPPVLVLITDGQATDDVESAMRRLLSVMWGDKAVKIALGVGRDADLDILQRFIHNDKIRPLAANNPEQLVEYVRWASTVPLSWASSPSKLASTITIQPAPQTSPDAEVSYIW